MRCEVEPVTTPFLADDQERAEGLVAIRRDLYMHRDRNTTQSACYKLHSWAMVQFAVYSKENGYSTRVEQYVVIA